MHPAFQKCIRRLYLLPTRLSMTAIREHTEMQQVAMREEPERAARIQILIRDDVSCVIHRALKVRRKAGGKFFQLSLDGEHFLWVNYAWSVVVGYVMSLKHCPRVC